MPAPRRAIVAVLLFVVLPLAPYYFALWMVGMVWPFNHCITEVRGHARGILGLDFEFSEVACTTLGNDASLTVFVSRSGRKERTAIFKFSPAFADEMPRITAIDGNTLSISIDRVIDIYFRKEEWEGISIVYDIRKIDFP